MELFISGSFPLLCNSGGRKQLTQMTRDLALRHPQSSVCGFRISPVTCLHNRYPDLFPTIDSQPRGKEHVNWLDTRTPQIA